jgi:hypothetical protein
MPAAIDLPEEKVYLQCTATSRRSRMPQLVDSMSPACAPQPNHSFNSVNANSNTSS